MDCPGHPKTGFRYDVYPDSALQCRICPAVPALSTASGAMQDLPHMVMIVCPPQPTEIHDTAIC